jgi:Erv1 / Alr family
MKTSFWGPHAWKFLHAVTFAYPDEPTKEHKKAALDLFSSLKLMLPCGECCNHYCQSFDKHNIEASLESRDTLSRWLVNFHNNVNQRLGKPILKYEDVAKEYIEANEFCSLAPSCKEEPMAEKPSYIQTSDKIMISVIVVFFISFILFKIVKKLK